jgi:hypothetical protein
VVIRRNKLLKGTFEKEMNFKKDRKKMDNEKDHDF